MKKLLYLLVIVSLLMFVSPVTWTMAQDPTEEPPAAPTEEPTAEPTEEVPPAEEPTTEPTEEPPVPTEEPTAEPTEEVPPTEEPTAEPTEEVPPTEEPTAEPTEEVPPTEEPTAEPTEEVPPTEEPTVEPTEEVPPTEEPTAEPTEEVLPTEEPTAEPTEEVLPTEELTVTPVITLTATPVVTETATPIPVTISHIAIRDAADGLGNQVVTHTMTVGEEFTIYAAAYDAEGNYLWDVPVDWSMTGTLEQAAPVVEVIPEEPAPEEAVTEEAPVPEEGATEEAVAPEEEDVAGEEVVPEEEPVPEPVATEEPTEEAEEDTRTISFTFVPAALGEGTIVADDGNEHVSETETITVLPEEKPKEPVISHIVIRDAADGYGSQHISVTLNVSDTFKVYAAAYDIEGNFLKDVPADWTTTGTLDVVTATQVSSFTFAPVTPDTSGTIEAEDEDGRGDATETISVIPAMMAASVDGQALPGSWTTELVNIESLSSGSSATVNLGLYDSSGNKVQDISLPSSIPPNGNAGVYPNQITDDGLYSAVVSSDQSVVALVHNSNYTAQASDVYLGFGDIGSQVGNPIYFPQANCDFSTHWSTKFYVQNLGDSSQSFRLRWYRTGETGFTIEDTTPTSIAVNATYSFDMEDYKGTIGGETGYVIIEGLGGGDLAAVGDQVRHQASVNDIVVTSSPGLPRAAAGRNLVAPVFYREYSGGWNAYMSIMNLGDVATTVDLRFVQRSTLNVTPWSVSIQPKESARIVTRDVLGNDSWIGSVTITAYSSDVIAGIAVNKYTSDGTVGFNWSALNSATAKANAAVPLVYRNAGGDGNDWTSSIQVYNTGSTGTVTAHMVRSEDNTAGGADWAAFDMTMSIEGNSSNNFNINRFTNEHGSIPQGWYGAAYVSAGGRNILVTSASTAYDRGVAFQFVCPNYVPSS